MNCPWHPNKRVVSACKECGADFCIECVRETDQTTLCPDCFRRKMGEVAREYAEPAEEEAKPAAVPTAAAARERPPERAEETAAPIEGGEEEAEEKTAVRPGKAAAAVGILGRRGRKERRKKPAPVSEPPAPPRGDFLSQGPDEDFSQIAGEKERKGGRFRRSRTSAVPAAEVAEALEAQETAPAVETTVEVAETPRAKEAEPATETPGPSEESLLQDVVSTLLKPEAGAVEGPAVMATEVEEEAPVERAPAKARAERVKKAPAKAKVKKERDPERWSFLAQPRSSQYTMLATSWWRSTLFIALVLLGGAIIWAAVNVYVLPGDKEHGIFAIAIGIVIGLAFWWKVGKKHGTKLAVQTSLTAFFALFIGEFLLWFLIIMKYSAFRTIFFDLISFKFIWENGAEIMKNVMEAMFPTSFIWLLLLPAAVAFIIGFGLPPIPEIFVQIWHALRGKAPEEKEASHGLEG